MDCLLYLFSIMVVFSTIFYFGLGCKDDPVTDDIAGSTVNIEVLPESINELITDEINITCTPQDLPLGTKKILFIELGKEGEHSLASLDGPALELGSDVKNNMEANGRISENLSESYLQLTIQRPFVDDVGVYCCRMFYQNEFGDLKMGHVYADVTVENNDKAVFVHLLQGLSDLKRYTKDLENDLLKEKNYTKDLEKDLLEQKNYTKDLEKYLLEQKKYTNNLEKRIMDKDTQVTSRFDELEMAGANRSHVIQGIVERETFSSAFSVYGTKNTFSDGETLTFKHFLLNIGNNYNIATGVFTAPRKGLYGFHLFLWTYRGDDSYIHLKVNDVIMASLIAYDSESVDQSSVSTVVFLNEGDRVQPYVQHGSRLVAENEHYTEFNGYLLQLL